MSTFLTGIAVGIFLAYLWKSIYGFLDKILYVPWRETKRGGQR